MWALAHAAPRARRARSCPTTACVERAARGRRRRRRAPARRAHAARSVDGRGRLHDQRVAAPGPAQIADMAGIEGVARHPRQGDHDRDEPPAGEHGGQPLHDARRRRHPRPDPDRLRDRHDRHPRRGPRRPAGHAGRGRRRCSTTASGSCPASARRARCASGPACARCSRTRRPARRPTRATSAARHALLDHRERDGVDGFLTITGGKLTTIRLMAEDAVDAMCEQLGDDRPCTTRRARCPGSEDGALLRARRRACGARERPPARRAARSASAS